MLIYVINNRCFGGAVSWDKALCVGASYSESDETITHQIVDRPNPPQLYISRQVLNIGKSGFMAITMLFSFRTGIIYNRSGCLTVSTLKCFCL